MRVAEKLRLALAASFFSRGWSAALGLLAVPLYLRYLGVEAYGVVGIFTSLSALVSFLDLGLGATMTREMSKQPVGQIVSIKSRDAARTFELAYLALALLVGTIGAMLAYPLGMIWVTVETLSRDDVVHALLLASIALACQWQSNLYSAGLAGLQRQVLLGAATILVSTIRVVLTLAAIWWDPTLRTFFTAQIVSSMVQTIVLRSIFWRSIGGNVKAPRFRWEAVRNSLGFAGGMTGIALTSIIQTQTDKVVLSRALNLSDFGVYSAVGALAAGLYMVIAPLFSVMFPRFSLLVQQGSERELIAKYHASSQLMAALVIPLAMLTVVFGYEILFAWTGDHGLSSGGANILLFLIVGNACNGLVNMPYALQLAYGWTRLMLWFNICSIVVLAPAIWWSASEFGAVGAAAVWAVLNLGYLLLLPNLMHRKLLKKEKLIWYATSIALPLSISSLLFLLFKQFSLSDLSRIQLFFTLTFYWCASTVIVVASMPELRRYATRWWATRGQH